VVFVRVPLAAHAAAAVWCSCGVAALITDVTGQVVTANIIVKACAKALTFADAEEPPTVGVSRLMASDYLSY